MKEENSLDIKKIDAQGNVAMVLEHRGRQRNRVKSDNVGSSTGMGGSPF